MQQNIYEYLNGNFPGFWSDINIRFELGAPYPNGSDERINQVNRRVVTIFEEIFNSDDEIVLYIKDWENEKDIMFGNTTPDYIYELLKDKEINEVKLFEMEEDEDEKGNKIQTKLEYLVRYTGGNISTFPYPKILEGIAQYEQGREPSIGQSVYFISKEKNIVFHMYDDRGCIVYAKSKDSIRKLYQEYNEWIVDYWREYFDSLFGEE